jgi:hypothetical protein
LSLRGAVRSLDAVELRPVAISSVKSLIFTAKDLAACKFLEAFQFPSLLYFVLELDWGTRAPVHHDQQLDRLTKCLHKLIGPVVASIQNRRLGINIMLDVTEDNYEYIDHVTFRVSSVDQPSASGCTLSHNLHSSFRLSGVVPLVQAGFSKSSACKNLFALISPTEGEVHIVDRGLSSVALVQRILKYCSSARTLILRGSHSAQEHSLLGKTADRKLPLSQRVLPGLRTLVLREISFDDEIISNLADLLMDRGLEEIRLVKCANAMSHFGVLTTLADRVVWDGFSVLSDVH